jgi:hypothetical protein
MDAEHRRLFLKLVAGLTIALGADSTAHAIGTPIEERVRAVRAAEETKIDSLKEKLLPGQNPAKADLGKSFSEAEIQFLQWGNWGNWGNWNNWNNFANFANWNNWANWGNWANGR